MTTGWVGVLRVGAMAVAVLWGLALIAVAVAVGHCSAFGGQCPSEAPPLLDDDVFRLATVGAALALGSPALLARRLAGRRVLAAGGAVVASVLVGLLARSAVLG